MKGPKDWSPEDETKKKARFAENEAYADLTIIFADLKAKYPQIGLSFGYIGNVENWGDDRHWYFFTEVLGEGNWGLERINFGGYRTSELPKFAKEAREKLEPWIKRRLLPKLEKESEKNPGGTMSGAKDWAPGPLSINDERVRKLHERIRDAAAAAEYAYWAEIRKAFPEVKTGDFLLEEEVAWDLASTRVLLTWLRLNHPNQHTLKPILDEHLQ
jgi:hypothetical protein